MPRLEHDTSTPALEQRCVGPTFTETHTSAMSADLAVVESGSLVDDLASGNLVDVCGGTVDEVLAYTMAVASSYAYGENAFMAHAMAALGMPRCRVHTIGTSMFGLVVRSVAHVIQSDDGRVAIVAYRGSDLFQTINVWTDLDTTPITVGVRRDPQSGDDVDAEVSVHPGFYRNMRATQALVLDDLRAALAGRSIHPGDDHAVSPLQALYVTGHSLGGAMASLLSVALHSSTRHAPLARVLTGCVTFGQPMCGDDRLAAQAARSVDAAPSAAGKTFRYVHRRDLIPHVPPRSVGRYVHFGSEVRWVPGREGWLPSGRAVGQLRGPLATLRGFLSYPALRVGLGNPLLFPHSLDDHAMHHYLGRTRPVGWAPEVLGDPLLSPRRYHPNGVSSMNGAE